SAHGTCEPQFASRIQEEQHTFPRAISFSGLPQATPFVHVDDLTMMDSTHGFLYAECDSGYRDDACFCNACGLNTKDSAGKNHSRFASQKAKMICRWQVWARLGMGQSGERDGDQAGKKLWAHAASYCEARSSDGSGKILVVIKC